MSTNLDDLLRAREDLALALDAKLKDLPEWRAMRAIDRAIAALAANPFLSPSRVPVRPLVPPRRQVGGESATGSTPRLYPTYTALARSFIEFKSAPITTPELIEFIGKNRPLHPDPEKAKVNITSTLSKDKEFVSIPWEGGRAWWLSDRTLPVREEQFSLGEASP